VASCIQDQLATVSGRRELIWGALAAAELCWAAPIFLLVMHPLAPHPPLLLWLAMLALLLGFFYVYRALVKAELSLRLQQTLVVGTLLLTVILTLRFHVYASAGLRGADWFIEPLRSLTVLTEGIPVAFIATLTLTYLWARGIHLAHRSLTSRSVGFSFRSGVLLVIAAALAVRLFADQDISGFVVGYFFFALAAVALSRIEDVARAPNSTRVRFGGFWLGVTVVSVALLIAAGTALAFIFHAGALELVLRWLSPLLIVVQLVVVAIGLLIFLVLDWLLTVLPIDWSYLRLALQSIIDTLSALSPPAMPGTEIDNAVLERTFGAAQATCLSAIVVVIILGVVLFTWQRLLRSREQDADELRESTLTAGALADNLLAMLRAGRDRLGQLAGLVDQFGLGSRLLSAITIRRIYANLVRLATRAGYPRARSETPFEYVGTLQQVWPGLESDVALITDAYVQAHYGQVPESRDELQQIRACWERIRAQGPSQQAGKQGTEKASPEAT
jgi:hypothetical protein